jgi:hypothetical protein
MVVSLCMAEAGRSRRCDAVARVFHMPGYVRFQPHRKREYRGTRHRYILNEYVIDAGAATLAALASEPGFRASP